MLWPEKPTCHRGEPHFAQMEDDAWRAPWTPDAGASIPFRTCNYCGSIHPSDLLDGLALVPATRSVRIPGAEQMLLKNVEIADWKYGFPHKIYIDEMPNPNSDRECLVGYTTRDGVKSDFKYAKEGLVRAKFYTRHLFDDGYDPEAFTAIITALAERCGLLFGVERETMTLTWRPFP